MTPMDDRLIEALRNTHLAYLADIRAMIHELISLPAPAEEKVADIVGEVRALEVRLGEWRRGLVKEATAEGESVEGSGYALAVGHKAKRTYNTTGILHAAAQGRTLDVTLRDMIAEKAVRLEWLWQPRGGGGVPAYFVKRRLELRIVGGEVEDGDLNAPHVGEVWEDVTRLEGKGET